MRVLLLDVVLEDDLVREPNPALARVLPGEHAGAATHLDLIFSPPAQNFSHLFKSSTDFLFPHLHRCFSKVSHEHFTYIFTPNPPPFLFSPVVLFADFLLVFFAFLIRISLAIGGGRLFCHAMQVSQLRRGPFFRPPSFLHTLFLAAPVSMKEAAGGRREGREGGVRSKPPRRRRRRRRGIVKTNVYTPASVINLQGKRRKFANVSEQAQKKSKLAQIYLRFWW